MADTKPCHECAPEYRRARQRLAKDECQAPLRFRRFNSQMTKTRIAAMAALAGSFASA